MKQLETDIEQPVVDWAEWHFIPHVKLNIAGRRGWPDRCFFIAGGRPLLIEFKRRGEKPMKLQFYILNMLTKRGYDARWTDSAEEAIGWLEKARANSARVSKARAKAARLPKARG